ncbi:capsular polysaccharide synthesis protein [Pluralibacter gergoviae]|uniref:capsular polysaccharide synthesis protein n=1 Tax=Pluralibacter gergoviae TaxID=61647 RepID=UPI003310A167|nr:hypothetical protein [Pluralibacter gergoviae]
MKYLLIKILKKTSHLLKSEFLSSIYKKSFLHLLEDSLGRPDFEKYNVSASKQNASIIWVYWAQGFSTAPAVVKHCISQLQKNIPQHFTLRMINDENIHDYITIPSIITLRVQQGIITKTHFSDILRFELLRKYGGIWIDSTVLVSDNFEDILNERNEFITLNHSNHNIFTSITDGKWTSFFIGMPKNSALASFMCDAFVLYWQNNEKLIDYVLIDYLIALAYKKIPAVSLMIDGQVSEIGNNRWLLQNIYDKAIDHMCDECLRQDSIRIYKLTYKFTPPQDSNTYYYKYFISSVV